MEHNIIEPTNRSHRIIFTVITILITAGIVGGSVWYSLNQEFKKQNTKIEELKRELAKLNIEVNENKGTEDRCTEIVNDDKKKEGWKEASDLDYSIKYPEDWLFEKYGSNAMGLDTKKNISERSPQIPETRPTMMARRNDLNSLSTQYNKPFKSFEDYYDYLKLDDVKITETNFGGKPAKTFIQQGLSTSYIITVVHKDILYSFDVVTDKETTKEAWDSLPKDLRGILDTIKFN